MNNHDDEAPPERINALDRGTDFLYIAMLQATTIDCSCTPCHSLRSMAKVVARGSVAAPAAPPSTPHQEPRSPAHELPEEVIPSLTPQTGVSETGPEG